MVVVHPIMVEVVAINLSPSVPNVEAMVRVAMTNFSFSVSLSKVQINLIVLSVGCVWTTTRRACSLEMENNQQFNQLIVLVFFVHLWPIATGSEIVT